MGALNWAPLMPRDAILSDSYKYKIIFLSYYCSQVGMCARIKNFMKRGGEGVAIPVLDFGQLSLTAASPFLGALVPGVVYPTIENNMYRAPIYPHNLPETGACLLKKLLNL